MKKIKKVFKNNYKILIGLILGLVISLGGVYAVTTIVGSNVTYSNSSSGLSSTTVQDAIDELYMRASTYIDSSYIDFGTLTTNTSKTVLASSSGLCIKRNEKISCFKKNKWVEEKTHIQNVFLDVSCNVKSSYVYCHALDFDCGVYSTGSVICFAKSDSSSCTVNSDGSVNCT